MDRLTSLHDRLRDVCLELAWRQWTAAGVAGTRENSGALLDPEALLIASVSLGRYDARLFDEVLDWLMRNARLLDVARLRRLGGRAEPAERRLLGVAAQLVTAEGGAASFRRLLAHDRAREDGSPDVEELFFSTAGQAASWVERDPLFAAAGFLRPPLRLRGLSGSPKAANPACLRFQVRALVGVGSRAEVLVYLATHDWTHGRLVAERTAYGQAPVASYLASLLEMRLVDRREEGKKVLYRLGDSLRDVLPVRPLFVDWIRVWPALAALLAAVRLTPLSTEVSEEARWVRLATALAGREAALRTEGFGVEVGDLREWALQGPEVLSHAVEEIAARVEQLAA